MRFVVLVAFLGCALAASVDRLRRDGNPMRKMPTLHKRPDQEGEDAGHKGKDGALGRVRRASGETVVCVDSKSTFQDSAMKASIQSAMKAFEDVSCVKFVLDDPNCESKTSGKLASVKGDEPGCWSTIGFKTGSPQINLSDPCDSYGNGLIIHELFHLLGRFHEHVRSDRDAYVKVVTDNIKDGKKHNFAKIEGKTYEVAYDYESIMHYGTDFFTTGGDTLEILNDMYKHKVGRQEKLSLLDIVTVNKMFNCYDDALDPYDCEHHAVKNNKGVCICMEPFTGDRCENVDSSKATHKLNTDLKTIEVTSDNYPNNYDLNTNQHILFECPKTYKAVIKFIDFDMEGWGCGYDKVTLTQGAQDIYANTGCGAQFKDKTYTSLDEVIYLTFFSDDMYTYKGYKLEFTCKAP